MPQVRAAAKPTTLGHYTLIERIGLGGQAEVWRAHDESRGVDIALKVLAPSVARDPGAWEALEREHAVSGRLQHPGILQVLAPERVDDVVVLPMELAGGGDLRRLRGAGYLEIVPILLEVAETLEYAHARGVVHRDLKPGNVLLDSRGRVKVADFGIAALLPAPGAVAGDSRSAGHSPFSASPEQLRGEPPSAADDIYGLGALAYELLSGHPPYYPNFELRRALTQPVPELSPTRQIPPELGELVMRMLAKSASQRPASMQSVMDEFEATLNATLSFAPEGVDESDAGDSAADALEGPGSEALASPAPERPASEASAIPAPGPRVAEPEVKESRPLGSPTSEPRAPERLVEEPRISPPRFAQPRRATVTPSPFRFDLRHQRGDAAARPAGVAATARPASPRPLADAATPTQVESAPPQPQAAERPQLPEQPTHNFIPPAVSVSPDPVIGLESTEPRLRAVPAPGRRQSPPWAGSRRARRWPYLLSGLLCGAVLICGATAAALFWLPRQDVARLQALLASIAPAVSQATSPAPAPAPEKPPASLASATPPPKPQSDPAALARLTRERADFDKRAAALAARGAAAWGGADFAAAQMQAAESSGAAAAGGIPIALQRLNQAERLLANVAQKEPQALASQLRTGDVALAAGHQEQASQAYALARRIDPNSQRAIDGARRAHMLKGVLPLLADAQKAEAAHNYSRAAQDFSQALALDPGNDLAEAGLTRANAAFGDDNYARAVGAGFAALGAGRLTEAHADFQQAVDLRPHGAEAADGLQRVSAAMTAGRVAALRRQAASLEAQERWSQAAAVYDTLLRENPSLGYAKRGKARDQERAELAASLQQIIDHPDALALPSVRDEAVNLLQEAREQMPLGPVLQSQVERLAGLLPQLERPVQLNMVSDNATQVSIPSIGVFGSFGRREIRLKPGTYTVVGTRDGYRAVHQEFTVEPGQQSVTITVSCSEPI